MRLMRFHPQAEHVPGKQMMVADTLSRSPLKQEQEPDTVEDVQDFVGLIESTRPATDTQMRRIREANTRDVQLQKATELTLQGGQSAWERSHSRYESSSILGDTCQ